MNILKYTPYVYLIVALLLAIESYNQYKAGTMNNAIFMGIFTIAAIFMFFFRRKYAKKFAERNKKT